MHIARHKKISFAFIVKELYNVSTIHLFFGGMEVILTVPLILAVLIVAQRTEFWQRGVWQAGRTCLAPYDCGLLRAARCGLPTKRREDDDLRSEDHSRRNATPI